MHTRPIPLPIIRSQLQYHEFSSLQVARDWEEWLARIGPVTRPPYARPTLQPTTPLGSDQLNVFHFISPDTFPHLLQMEEP
jgi:hypothetical protein